MPRRPAGPIVVATRSVHKLEEIRAILREAAGPEVIGLVEAGVAEDPAEEEIEGFDSFRENAFAKARHFARLTGRPTLADDSGLCVDALGGAPGVHSKRFSGRDDLRGAALDAANNAALLERLSGVPASGRAAQFRCVLALVGPEGEETFEGRRDGTILEAQRGEGGFGYDPLFFLPEVGASMAEIDAAEKNRRSHRARAVRAFAAWYRG